MADSYSEPPVFEGTDPKECEAFVAAVRRRGLEQGKLRDHEWMAGFVSGYLGGDALYWYEDLDEDVQHDWSRLRPALLARFGRRGKIPAAAASGAPPISASASLNSIPTPAAAPPSTIPSPLIRKGRLKITDLHGNRLGYIDKSDNGKGLHEKQSVNADGALLVSFASAVGGPLDIQIIDAFQNPQIIDILAITWESLSGDKWMERPRYAASLCSLSTVRSKTPYAVESKVWTISEDGQLCAEYPKPDGSTERLKAHKTTGDLIWWVKTSSNRNNNVRIVFEDAPHT